MRHTQSLLAPIFVLPNQCLGARAPGNFPIARRINGVAYDMRVLPYMQKNNRTHCILSGFLLKITENNESI
jgi:hypothetical protein